MSGRTPRPVPSWGELETGWLAGLLEGEGSFVITAMNKPPSPRTPRVSVAMTDKDVIEAAALLMGALSVTSKPVTDTPLGNPRKPQWQANVSGHQAIEVMLRVRPHMGRRRGARIDEIVAEWFAARPHLTQEAA